MFYFWLYGEISMKYLARIKLSENVFYFVEIWIYVGNFTHSEMNFDVYSFCIT